MNEHHNRNADQWADHVREAQGTAVEGIIEWGVRLRQAHEAYKLEPQRWGRTWEAWCRKEFGCGEVVASHRESLSENLCIIDTGIRQNLPHDWNSLYLLGNLARDYPEAFDAAVKGGKLSPNMKRSQVIELCGASSRAIRDQRNAALEAELSGQDWNLWHGSFRDWEVSEPVDLILTDPPYAKEHIDLYEDLPVYSDDWLSPNGWLAVMVGQGNLPVVASALAKGPLTYGWTFCLKHSASRTTAIHGIKIQSMWKPVLIFYKGKRDLEEWTLDHIEYDWKPKDGDYHKWQQDISPLQKLVRAMTKPDALVADPFCGSGTTGLAALSTSRRFVGCDEDELSINAAGARLSAAESTSDTVVHLRSVG